ncbi:hypothetical protein A7P95_09455 [Eikenella longinqua]|uniref:Uncharacterized protein n=2 Tax=Neisseriaceae TaxID=481 RepID=A0A1A9RU03_9NEIS|nr:hypothetical protein A7P95_09455 [Eikenella longinqua]
MGSRLYNRIFKFWIGKYPQELDERQMQLVNAHYAKFGIVCSALLLGLFLVCQFVILAGYLAGFDTNWPTWLFIIFLPYCYFAAKYPQPLTIELQNPADFTEQKMRHRAARRKKPAWLIGAALALGLIAVAKNRLPDIPVWLVAPFAVLAAAALMRVEHQEIGKTEHTLAEEVRKQQDEYSE